MKESLAQAAESADQLRQHLRAAHRTATETNQFAEIVLLDLLTQASDLKNKIERASIAAQDND